MEQAYSRRCVCVLAEETLLEHHNVHGMKIEGLYEEQQQSIREESHIFPFENLQVSTNVHNASSKRNTFHFSLEPLLVLIEYVPYGDLLGYLRKSRGLNDTYYKDPDIKPETSLTSQQLIKFAWQVADGMSYLSSRSVSAINLRNLTLYLLQNLLRAHWLRFMSYRIVRSMG